MSSVDVNEMLDRIVAIEKAYFASISQAVDSLPYALHSQESFPYLTHRVSRLDLSYEDEDYTVNTYTVLSRLIIGHVTENYVGMTEDNLYTWLPGLVTYFQQRRLLQSAAYPVSMNKLVGAEMQQGASTGLVIFQNTGISAQQVGTEFTTICEFNETIEQAY